MIVGVLQPGFLPWIGFFAHVAACDRYVIYDCVQYDRESWRNRNRVRSPEGWQWLTVPVRGAGRFGQTNADVEIDNSTGWRKRHRRTLHQLYAKAPYYAAHAAFLDELYETAWTRLVDVDLFAIEYLLRAFGIDTPLMRSSTLALTGTRNERLIDVCTRLGANTYLSTDAGAAYLDADLFASRGIAVRFQHYRHPIYPQAHDGFVSHMSALDLLLNCGPESRAVMIDAVRGHSAPEHLPRDDRRAFAR